MTPHTVPLTYSTAEAADLLGVSAWTVRRLVKDGRLEVVPAMAHHWRVTAGSLARLTEGQSAA